MIPDILRHVPRKGENLMFNEKKLDELATRMKEKEISIPTDLAGSILFFLLGAVLFFMLPSQVPISENDVINGRVFPKLLFSLMMICSAVLIIQNIIKISKKQPVQVSTFNLLTEVKALMILTILFITYFICGSVCSGSNFLLHCVPCLFPLQKTVLLCDHHRNGRAHLGGIPFRSERKILERRNRICSNISSLL